MRKILLHTILLAFFAAPCQAQIDSTAEKKDTTTEKKITIASLIPEDPLGLVSDFEKVFDQEQIKFMDSLCRAHEKLTTNQIAIVSLDINEEDLAEAGEWEELCTQLMTKWGVGDEKLDNGVGIIFSVKLRKVRIAVGDGLRYKLTDKECQAIINKIIIAEFRKAAYYKGILNALYAVMKEVQ